MGSPILKRTIHVSLGFTAFICLVLVLSVSLRKSTKSYNSLQIPIAMSPLSTSAEPTALTADTVLQPLATLATTPIEEPVAKELEEETPQNWQTVKIKEKDTLSKIFTRLGVSTKDIHEIMTSDPASKPLAGLKPGQTLKVHINEEQQVEGLTLEMAPGNTLYVWRKEEGFQIEQKVVPLEKKLAFGKGEIQNSLFSAGKRAGLDHQVLSQMVEIFGWNIDFALDLQPNDTFRVLYEEKCLDGERIQTGNILAAEIVNGGKKHQAVRYQDKKAGLSGYYTPEGYGMHQAFLRAPLNFTRISSHFGNRHHPILHRLRNHKGTDYSAPHGTPVQATGDGKVIFMGKRGGYGNVVELQHGARYSTLYAHLSRFPKNLRNGAEVKQGQVIGFVGHTGLATGDHLHYEFRIGGIHHNPLTVALPRKNSIPAKQKPHFIAHAKEMLHLLDMHEHKVEVAFSDNILVNE